MTLSSAIVFTTLSSDFYLARLLSILTLWRWKSYRGGFGRSHQVRWKRVSERGGCVVNGCSIVFARLQAAQAETKMVALALHTTYLGLLMGERWFSDLQQRCANKNPVLDRPAFSWPRLQRRGPAGRRKRRGSSTNRDGRLSALQLWNVIPMKQRWTQRLGNQQSRVGGTDCKQGREKSIKN